MTAGYFSSFTTSIRRAFGKNPLAEARLSVSEGFGSPQLENMTVSSSRQPLGRRK